MGASHFRDAGAQHGRAIVAPQTEDYVSLVRCGGRQRLGEREATMTRVIATILVALFAGKSTLARACLAAVASYWG